MDLMFREIVKQQKRAKTMMGSYFHVTIVSSFNNEHTFLLALLLI